MNVDKKKTLIHGAAKKQEVTARRSLCKTRAFNCPPKRRKLATCTPTTDNSDGPVTRTSIGPRDNTRERV